MSLPVQDGTSNSQPVLSLTQCLIACESAPGCSVVTYSPGDQNCFLKGCPASTLQTVRYDTSHHNLCCGGAYCGSVLNLAVAFIMALIS